MTPLAALNAHRQRAGLVPLMEDAALLQLAETRAVQVAEHYGHADGLPASEVLTVGTFRDAAALLWEWLAWPAHRSIVLDGLATRAGFGSHVKDGQTYWVGLIGR